MSKKQTSVSHSSTESEIISLDAGLRMDGLPALDLWDNVIEVLRSTDNTIKPSHDSIRETFAIQNSKTRRKSGITRSTTTAADSLVAKNAFKATQRRQVEERTRSITHEDKSATGAGKRPPVLPVVCQWRIRSHTTVALEEFVMIVGKMSAIVLAPTTQKAWREAGCERWECKETGWQHGCCGVEHFWSKVESFFCVCSGQDKTCLGKRLVS